MSRSVVCSNCGHSLSMSEDIYNRRVAGKVVTIKCRQCGTPIRVDGRQEGSQVPSPPAESAAAPEVPPLAAPPPFINDPLDPFSLPEAAAPARPRPPLPSLDDVVSSAPKIPTGLTASDSPFAARREEAPAPLAPRAAPPAAPPAGRAAPPAPPPRADAVPPEVATNPFAVPPVAPPVAGAPAVASPPEAAPAGPPRLPAEPAAPPAASAAAAANPFMAAPAAPPGPSPAVASPPAAAPPVAAPAVAAPPVAPAAAVRAAPIAAPESFAIPAAAPVPDLASLDPATLRDPHAAFRRKSPKGVLAAVAGVVLVMGGVIYASGGGEEESAKNAKKPAAGADKPVIGVSLAPYRSDADESLPVKPAPERPASKPTEEAAPVETGSPDDFAKRFKAASGRE